MLKNLPDLWAVGVDFGVETEKTIQEFAKNHTTEITENANVQDLTRDQLTKLFECVDQRKYCSACIDCIFKWKSIRAETEEDAANLLSKIDLQYLYYRSLHNLLESNSSNEKNKTIENVLSRKAVTRLATVIEECQNIAKEMIEKCNAEDSCYLCGSQFTHLRHFAEKLPK
uniref:Uncharacterized protein n=1 Tax=Strigamia maritima TaxID=126957 RepID=T1ITG1_STRMM